VRPGGEGGGEGEVERICGVLTSIRKRRRRPDLVATAGGGRLGFHWPAVLRQFSDDIRGETDAARRRGYLCDAGLFRGRLDAADRAAGGGALLSAMRTVFSTRCCSVDGMRTETGGERAARRRGSRGVVGLLRDGSWPANRRGDRRSKLCVSSGSDGCAEQWRARG
jgi:hypothetical protein